MHLYENSKKYLFCVLFLFSLFYDKVRRYGLLLTLRWGACLDNLCFFSVPAFVVLKSASSAMNSAKMDFQTKRFYNKSALDVCKHIRV